MSQQINLYNPALLPKPDALSGKTMLVTLSALTVALIAAYGVAAWLASRAAARETIAAGALAQVQSEVTRLSQEISGRKPSPQLSAELSNLEALLAQRNEVIGVLKSGALGDTKGVSEYFRAFARETVDGLWLTGFTVVGAGQDISIEGRTLNAELVPQYIQRLGREEALRGHGFATLSVQAPADTNLNPEARKSAEFLEFRMASRVPEAQSSRGRAQ